MSYQWINTAEQLREWLAPIAPNTPLFVDTEFMRERTFWAELALVQVRVGDRIALIDAPAIGDAGPLHALIGDYPLVMHACSEDLEVLNYFSGASPQQVYDTQVGAALAGHDLQASYQRLVHDIVQADIPKDATRTNWLARPLSPQQLEYAKDDVLWLPALHNHLHGELETLGRTPWWEEECNRLRDAALSQIPPEKMWRNVKGVGHLQDGQALARLQALADWRERAARQRNLPRSFVLRDPQLLELAERNPNSRRQLEALNIPSPVIRRYGDVLLEALQQGSQAEPLPLLPGPPTEQDKKTINMVRKGVQALSKELNVVPEVLMRRRWLEQWVRNPEFLPEPLTGWRRDVVVAPLIPLL